MTPIRSKPMPLSHDQERWMTAYIKEQVTKGVITPIKADENPVIVTPVFLVPGA